jgi:hypothetical protein
MFSMETPDVFEQSGVSDSPQELPILMLKV